MAAPLASVVPAAVAPLAAAADRPQAVVAVDRPAVVADAAVVAVAVARFN